MSILLKTDSEISEMRISGKMLADVLSTTAKNTVDGITSKELALIAAKELHALGGKPAFLGYHGFPNVICISVNEEVQHTIPGERVIRDGDVVNLDFGVNYNGMITDSGITVGVGTISDDARRLLTGTELALEAAISVVRSGVRVGDISQAIEKVLKSHKLGIVRELVGHGVGRQLHEDPDIPNYYTGKGPELMAGATIAIEPITTLGKPDLVFDSDGWTIRSEDGTWSAQFEHTLLVTHDGAEILTARSA